MNDLTYRLLAFALESFLWGGEMTGDDLPERGPAVLVANHADAWGPVGIVSSVPHRLHPWVIADMMDAKLAAEYLRKDFIERQLHLDKPFSKWAAWMLSKLTVPLLNDAGCIPSYSNFEDLRVPFDLSVRILADGGFILIFPEDPTQPVDPYYKMSPFKKGFVRLGEFYFQHTGRALPFYPLAVHVKRREVQVGKPIMHNPYAQPASERLRIKHVLERMIREMLAGMNRDIYFRVPLQR